MLISWPTEEELAGRKKEFQLPLPTTEINWNDELSMEDNERE